MRIKLSENAVDPKVPMRSLSLTMSQDKQECIKICLRELTTFLYEEADKNDLTDLKSIEKTVHSQTLSGVSPEISFFY